MQCVGRSHLLYHTLHAASSMRCSSGTVLLPVPDAVFDSAPQPKDWSIKMNKKERRLALATALQSAAANTVTIRDLKVLCLCRTSRPQSHKCCRLSCLQWD